MNIDTRSVMQVQDQVCVVTGGASGIGKALCERFAAEGARKVVVVDLDPDKAGEVADAIGGQAEACDVGNEEQITEMLHRIENDFGPIDVLCNNAGIGSGGDPFTTPMSEWERQWQIHVMSHVYAVRAVLPGMLARGEGRLLHTASMAGILTSLGNVHYATTKHALVGLAEWLTMTYHDQGIRVHLLAPLGVRTPMMEGDRSDSEWARSAGGDMKEPSDVAQQVIEAFAEERFLILTDPVAQEWMEFKTSAPEKWLKGMRKLQARMDQAGG